MLDALSPAGRRVLVRFLGGRPLFAFDLDGTLAPLRDDPAKVRIPASTLERLEALCRLAPCAVVTGRPRRTALRLLEGTRLALVVGSQGAEWPGDPLDPLYPRLVRRWRRRLGLRLAGIPGVRFEAKPAALSVHYRLAPSPRAARRAIEQAVAGLPQCCAAAGKRVVNLAPEGAPDKGAALRRAAEALGCDRALFAGDDEGDEAAFAAPGLRVLGIRVGSGRGSRAALRLRSQPAIDRLLAALLEAAAQG